MSFHSLEFSFYLKEDLTFEILKYYAFIIVSNQFVFNSLFSLEKKVSIYEGPRS
jgi:hypothetical protein